jgi:hypothetical protein
MNAIREVLGEAWGAFVVEVKATMTALGFHLLNLVLVVVFNILWFGGIFLLLGLWLA